MPTEVLPIQTPDVSEETRTPPPYQVVLLDDQDHTYDYVIELLGHVFGYGLQTAFRMAQEVDATGRCSVFKGALEQAEFKRDKIHGYGADWRIERCKGSMSAYLEPLEA